MDQSGGDHQNAEQDRLQSDGALWKHWGPYLAERAWGTVREDYSPDGTAWDYFPHDHARSRAYRWNEDGLAGICDDQQRLCFAPAFWNGQDPILKERLFGLGGQEGNHGEDVKEIYYYLDNTPTHAYQQMLYKYSQRAFPYASLVEENRRRGKEDPEYNLMDTAAFADNRYFDIFVEYAKAEPDDILIRIRAANRGPETAVLHVLPTLWFRNTWSWGQEPGPGRHPKPALTAGRSPAELAIKADHYSLGRYHMVCQVTTLQLATPPELLFTENETNASRLFETPNPGPYVKDGFHERIVNGKLEAVNPAQVGTKAAVHYTLSIGSGETAVLRFRLAERHHAERGKSSRHRQDPFEDFDAIFALRQAQADAFYAVLQPPSLSEDEKRVQRQAFAGMLWSKQFYHYDVDVWLHGDPGQPKPPPERLHGRNHTWRHFNSADIVSMPDKWEYPWFAAWDLAFHCIPLAMLDLDFAKKQLILLGREWYQHPNGQVPAYEWAFGDVNPPVQAWASWRVYQLEKKLTGKGDLEFLERVFHKWMLNFIWWVNRKDSMGNNVFEGGFLGLDNVGVFDRSQPLPDGGTLEQSDSTSWMAMFCLNMLAISLELACHDPAYGDIATKFFEHFLYIADAMENIAGEGIRLWDAEDEFFYDVLHTREGQSFPIRIHSLVGLIPLYAVAVIGPELLDQVPDFKSRLEWFLEHRPQLASLVSHWSTPGKGETRLFAVLHGPRLKAVLRRMLDEAEFFSPFGVRSLSRYHASHPYEFTAGGSGATVTYEPAESTAGVFGGNSNWRGPVWFPVNYLIVESLRSFHEYYSHHFKVECPTGSGNTLTLREVADELSRRLVRIFLRDDQGRRAVFGHQDILQNDPAWRDHLLFYEYFNGDNGAGLGASHQTGWTGLVAQLLQEQGERRLVEPQVLPGEHAPEVH